MGFQSYNRQSIILQWHDSHPSAVIHPKARVGEGCEIGPYCVIGEHVELGAGCRLHSHVVIDGHTRLGARNEIFPFASIGLKTQDLAEVEGGRHADGDWG